MCAKELENIRKIPSFSLVLLTCFMSTKISNADYLKLEKSFEKFIRFSKKLKCQSVYKNICKFWWQWTNLSRFFLNVWSFTNDLCYISSLLRITQRGEIHGLTGNSEISSKTWTISKILWISIPSLYLSELVTKVRMFVRTFILHCGPQKW